jgi:hypothetical protein
MYAKLLQPSQGGSLSNNSGVTYTSTLARAALAGAWAWASAWSMAAIAYKN